MRVFAFYISSGFEYRSFVYSGLYSHLAKNHKCLVIRRDFNSQVALQLDQEDGLNVIIAPTSLLNYKRSRVEKLHVVARRASVRIKGGENFNYFRQDQRVTLWDYFKGNRLTVGLLRFLTLLINRQRYFDKAVQTLYEDEGITDLFLQGYSDVEKQALAITAEKYGLRIWVVVNSWKAPYVNGFIGFKPTRAFVWSKIMKDHLVELNPHLEKNIFSITGYAAFDRFNNYRPKKDLIYYANKYRFFSGRPIIFYTMISPLAYAKELEIIQKIDNIIEKNWAIDKFRPVVILRQNPIDHSTPDESLFLNRNVRYAENFWDVSYENDTFLQASEGETEWLDLLYYSRVTCNIASTVTMESLASGTPVINVEFGGDGFPDDSLKRYAAAPFYNCMFRRKDVKIVDNESDFLFHLQQYLQGQPGEHGSEILPESGNQCVSKMLAEILGY